MKGARLFPGLFLAVVSCATPPWAPNDDFWKDQTSVDWLLAQQNADGSFGHGTGRFEGFDVGPIGITGFVLLAVRSSGDSSGDRAVRVRRAVDWLLGMQDADGIFRGVQDETLDQAIATCALLDRCEILVDAKRVRAPALNALSAVMRSRLEDGTWGSRLRTWWAFAALGQARIEELPFDEKALSEVMEFLDREFDREPDFPTAVVPLVRHYHGAWEKKARSKPWIMDRLPDPRCPDFAAWDFGSTVVFGLTWDLDDDWKRWTEALELALKTTRLGDHWEGSTANSTLLRTAFALRCKEAYWVSRHVAGRNVFRSAK